MPHEALDSKLYTIAADATGGREGRTISEDGVVDLPLGKPGSTSNPKANPETLFAAGYAACYRFDHREKDAGTDRGAHADHRQREQPERAMQAGQGAGNANGCALVVMASRRFGT